MNVEELKIVAEAMQTMTGDAGDAFRWWLIMHYGTPLVENLLLGGAALVVIGRCWRAIPQLVKEIER